MKAMLGLAAALLTSGAGAQPSQASYCAVVGVFGRPATAADFAAPLRDAGQPVLAWASGPAHYVALGPYRSERAARAVLPVLHARGLVGPSSESVVAPCPTS